MEDPVIAGNGAQEEVLILDMEEIGAQVVVTILEMEEIGAPEAPITLEMEETGIVEATITLVMEVTILALMWLRLVTSIQTMKIGSLVVTGIVLVIELNLCIKIISLGLGATHNLVVVQFSWTNGVKVVGTIQEIIQEIGDQEEDIIQEVVEIGIQEVDITKELLELQKRVNSQIKMKPLTKILRN